MGTDRQIVSRLARTTRVLYVDPPTPLMPRHIETLRAPSLAQLGANLWRLSPKTVPGVTRPVGRSVAAALARRAIRRAVAQLGGEVHAVVVSSLDPYLDVCETDRRVFYGTDDFRAGATLMGVSQRRVEHREAGQLRSASAVVAVSEQLADRWRSLENDVVVIPNGCDVENFARTDVVSPASDIVLDAPIAGVVGQLNNRIDFDILEAVANLGSSLLLVGPTFEPIDRRRLDALVARPNVQWVGRRPFEEMPSYLQAIKVGLTPYTDTEFNRSSSPLKTLEYLAAGRAVVSSDLPAARLLRTDLVAIAQSPTEFAHFVAERLSADDDDDARARRRAFAATHSWDRRVEDIRHVLGLAGPDHPPRSSG